ncbi:MAG: hypothetical protein ACC645_14240 [Pirellulales bacterium]
MAVNFGQYGSVAGSVAGRPMSSAEDQGHCRQAVAVRTGWPPTITTVQGCQYS